MTCTESGLNNTKPKILSGSELICLGTNRGFNLLPKGKALLTSIDLPNEFGDNQYNIEMIWHERSDGDEDISYVKKKISNFCVEKFGF